MSRLLPAFALLLTGACSQTAPIVRAPTMGWANTFITAHRAAEAGDYVRADTLLATYASANPGSPESYEAIYWRGVLALDPANPHRSPTLATGAFEEYLRSPRGQVRRGEAMVLRRLAQRLEHGELATPLTASTRTTASAASAAGDSARRPDARDEEIAKLKEELRKSNEELERIKRRVSAPARVDPPTTPPPSP